MKTITINKEDIIEGFKNFSDITNSLHKKLVENGKIVEVNWLNDIEIELENKIYYVETHPYIDRIYKLGEIDIGINYIVYEENKNGKLLYIFKG